jgi:hypothetical protein
LIGSFGTICNSSFFAVSFGSHPETGEGWPLLTVQTKANGESWSTRERVPSLVVSFGTYLLVTWRVVSNPPCRRVADTSVWL